MAMDSVKNGAVIEKAEDTVTRRIFLAAAGAAGLCYVGALAYPIYRYLASPEEMAASASAVTEVMLKDAQKLPKESVLMFKFGPSPALLIHHEDGTWVSSARSARTWVARCSLSRSKSGFTALAMAGCMTRIRARM